MRKLQPEEVDEAGCCEEEEGRCGGCRAPPLEPPLEAPRPPSPPQLECCDEKGCGGCGQPPSEEHDPPPQRPEGDGEPPPGQEGLRPPTPVPYRELAAAARGGVHEESTYS